MCALCALLTQLKIHHKIQRLTAYRIGSHHPVAALSAGIDQVKRAWPAWLSGLDFGTKCKKNKTHQPNQLLPMVDKPRTNALARGLLVVYIRRARREGRNFCLWMRYYKFVKTFVVTKVLRNYSLAHTCNDPQRQKKIGG